MHYTSTIELNWKMIYRHLSCLSYFCSLDVLVAAILLYFTGENSQTTSPLADRFVSFEIFDY